MDGMLYINSLKYHICPAHNDFAIFFYSKVWHIDDNESAEQRNSMRNLHP